MSEFTVVIGVDDSEGSRRAVEWCAEVGSLLDAEFIAVHASPAEGQPLASQGQIDEWCALILETGAPLRRVVANEDPVRLLETVAEAEDADLIAVGASHRGELGDLVFASVVEGLVHHAHRPVLVVPAPQAGKS